MWKKLTSRCHPNKSNFKIFSNSADLEAWKNAALVQNSTNFWQKSRLAYFLQVSRLSFICWHFDRYLFSRWLADYFFLGGGRKGGYESMIKRHPDRSPISTLHTWKEENGNVVSQKPHRHETGLGFFKNMAIGHVFSTLRRVFSDGIFGRKPRKSEEARKKATDAPEEGRSKKGWLTYTLKGWNNLLLKGPF